MPFDLSTAKEVPTTGFNIETAKPVAKSSDTQTYFRAETKKTVSAELGLAGKELEYADDTQNNGQKKQDYLGFVNTGIDTVTNAAKGYIGGIVQMGFDLNSVNLGAKEKALAAIPTTRKSFSPVDMLLQFIPSNEGRFAEIRTSKYFGGDLSFEKETAKLSEDILTTKKINEQVPSVLKGMGLAKIEAPEGSGEVTKFITDLGFDLGNGLQSLAGAVGLTMISGNPAAATLVFSAQQKSQDYQEARKKGFSPEAADEVANVDAATQGAIEYIGTHTLFKFLENSKGLKKAFQGFLIEGSEEGAQQAAQILVKNGYNLTNTSFDAGVGQVAYASLVGGLIGAPISVMIESHPEEFEKETGVAPDDALEIAKHVEETIAKNPKLQVAAQSVVTETVDDQLSPFKDNDENKQQVHKIIGDFISGKDIDISNLSEEEQKILESHAEKGLAVIDAQDGRGMLPVPKRPQSLSEFIKAQGGLQVSGETQRYTRKETPKLKGVANKNGKLGLDEARALAVEAGFLTDSGGEGVTESSEQDLLDALDREAQGHDVVRGEDEGAALERNQVLDFNEQQDQANQEILSNSKQVKSFRAAFKEGVSAAKKDVKAAQGVLINALEKSNLRPEDRAKFIRQIKNIQTRKQLMKAAPDIEERVSSLIDADAKRNLREKIKSVLSSAKKRKDVSVDMLDNIKKLENDLSNTGVLGKGMKDTPVEKFKEALDQSKALVAEGKIKLLILKEQKKERMAQRLEDLENDTVPLSNTDLREAGLGERLSVVDKFKNLWTEGANKANRLNLNKNPMDVVFDIMDGAKDYKGANSRVFKQTVDAAYHKFLQLKEATTRDVKNLSDELNLDDRNFERIGAYAALQQDGGEAKLKATGVTQEEIDNLVLEPEELQMYDLMRERLDSLRPALKEVMSVVYNKEFKNVKNYFPFMTDFKAMRDFEIQEMFGDDVFEISDTPAEFNKKDVKKGFTKERTGGKQKIRIDGMGVFLNHVENATYLIEMGQTIKELGELAISNDFRDIAGDFGQEVVSNWIDLLARKGRVAGSVDFLDTFRQNAGAAVLAFKLSSALVQPTALMDGAAFIGGDYIARGVKSSVQTEWRQFIFDNMPEVRERIGDDPNYIDMGGDSIIGQAREAGFWALKKLDMMAATSVAAGAYTKSIEDRGGEVDLENPDPIAIAEAQLVVRRTQSSSFAKDAAPIISQGALTGNVSVDKIILQFQSFMLNRWSLIQHDMVDAGIKKGKTAKALNIATWLVLANISEYFIKRYTKELIALITGAEPPDDDSSTSEKIIKQAISNVPFVSTAVSSAQYGSVPVPAISMVEKISEELSYGIMSKSGEKKAKHFSEAAVLGVGTALGLPGTLQAQQLVKGAFDAGADKKKKGKSKVSTP